MRLAARSGVRVVLNGQGADETLAGYPRYVDDHWRALITSGRLAAAFKDIRAYTGGRGGNAYRLLLRSMHRAVEARMRSAGDGRGATKSNSWVGGDFHRTYAEFRRPVPRRQGLNASLKHSIQVNALPIYLRIEDRNSMAHSVEVRLPFLDPRVVAFAFGLPLDWKLRGPWNKYVLREAMRGRIPESVRTRVDKMGFPTSSDQWFRGSWYEPMQDLMASASFRERGIFNVSTIQADLERHRRGHLSAEKGLFRIAQLELWFRHSSPWAGRGDSPGRSLSLLPDLTMQAGPVLPREQCPEA
jgi:asparagine synthase (glutamine-hydrolysing)